MVPEPSAADWELTGFVDASVAAFAAAFDRAKPLSEQTAFSALAPGNSLPHDKVARAFALARRNGWIHTLLGQYVIGGEVGSRQGDLLTAAVRQGAIEPGSTLETLVDSNRGYSAAGLEVYHLHRVIRQVCRIEIDGKSKGTGFLVRPDVVITAYHVVYKLIQKEADSLVALPKSAARLQAVFDDFDVMDGGFRSRLRGLRVSVAEDWLDGVSPCHDLEFSGQFPADEAELSGKFDYALVRLARVARVGIPPVRIRELPPIRKNDPITIVQHSGGRSLALDHAAVTRLRGNWRFEHNVNSECGSSGSPCFDRSYNVIGLHQAGSAGQKSPGVCQINRAVPMIWARSVIEGLRSPASELMPLPDLTEGRPGHPVLGRMETQRWIWSQLREENAAEPKRPVLMLQGPSGSGKSFTADILRSLLPRTQHDIVVLDAASDVFGKQPEAFSALLLERLGYPPMPETPFDGNTQRIRWLLLTHLPALLNALEAGRAEDAARSRDVWIVVDGIDKASIGTETPISQYTFGLYAAVRTRRWLRVVLLGYEGRVPEVLRGLFDYHDLHRPDVYKYDPGEEGELRTDFMNYLQAKLPLGQYGEHSILVDTVLAAMEIVCKQLDGMPPATWLAHLQQNLATFAAVWARAGR